MVFHYQNHNNKSGTANNGNINRHRNYHCEVNLVNYNEFYLTGRNLLITLILLKEIAWKVAEVCNRIVNRIKESIKKK